MHNSSAVPLQFEITNISPTLCTTSITVPALYVDNVYVEAVRSQKVSLQSHGFYQADIPRNQIELNFQTNLIDHVKEFLFKYFVLGFLYKELRMRKIHFAGEPRLVDIAIEPHADARYEFELTLFNPIQLHEWKYFPFKAPKRKNYKDLDRQVESFIKDEIEARKEGPVVAQVGDWVGFNVALCDGQNNLLFKDHHELVWLRIGDEEADESAQELLVGKKVGDIFYSSSPCLQEYFSNQIDTAYKFFVEIKEIVQHSFFCLESFREYFRLKTKKELYQKLIEVFSYRNDLSQRRSMVEEALALLLHKHPFEVPNHLVLRQQKVVLEAVQKNPDYHVYRVQPDFNEMVRKLAVKQSKEMIIIDQLAYYENLQIGTPDIRNYLNLTKRPRTKEFIYFEPPALRMKNQETPLPNDFLKQACLREKALNYIIYHLTK